MKEMKQNNEWIQYCMDLAFEDKIMEITNIESNMIQTIIQTFFTEVRDNKFIRSKDKIIEFTDITIPPYYVQSHESKFNFNKTILKKILKEMLENIPEMNQIEMIIINPIQKCYENGIVPTDIDICENQSCLEYIENCSSTKNLNKCKRFLSNDMNWNKLVKEVQDMDVCKATDILIKFGFKYNNKSLKCFEPYTEWNNRTMKTLQIKEINNGLKKYIELLIEKANPISELKRKINMNGGGIGSVLSSYSLKNPELKETIDNHNMIEEKYHNAKYIVGRYNMMMDLFNDNEIFNRNNKYMYHDYYEKIHYKYLLEQKILLNSIENL
jgi:hypothetical protein